MQVSFPRRLTPVLARQAPWSSAGFGLFVSGLTGHHRTLWTFAKEEIAAVLPKLEWVTGRLSIGIPMSAAPEQQPSALLAGAINPWRAGMQFP